MCASKVLLTHLLLSYQAVPPVLSSSNHTLLPVCDCIHCIPIFLSLFFFFFVWKLIMPQRNERTEFVQLLWLEWIWKECTHCTYAHSNCHGVDAHTAIAMWRVMVAHCSPCNQTNTTNTSFSKRERETSLGAILGSPWTPCDRRGASGQPRWPSVRHQQWWRATLKQKEIHFQSELLLGNHCNFSFS